MIPFQIAQNWLHLCKKVSVSTWQSSTTSSTSMPCLSKHGNFWDEIFTSKVYMDTLFHCGQYSNNGPVPYKIYKDMFCVMYW